MSDHVSESERAAIAAFAGPVTRCPDGNARNCNMLIEAFETSKYVRTEYGEDIPVTSLTRTGDSALATILPRLLDAATPGRPSSPADTQMLRNFRILHLAEGGVLAARIAERFRLTRNYVDKILRRLRRLSETRESVHGRQRGEPPWQPSSESIAIPERSPAMKSAARVCA